MTIFHSKSGAQIHIKVVKEDNIQFHSVFQVVKYILTVSENHVVCSVLAVPSIGLVYILKFHLSRENLTHYVMTDILF